MLTMPTVSSGTFLIKPGMWVLPEQLAPDAAAGNSLTGCDARNAWHDDKKIC